MRPLKLIMQAFGPYANREEINFNKLENRTMFVISGKTGSGKTAIFDGICYAIYGKASRDERDGTTLRSQFAKKDTRTEVQLTFALRNKTYKIKRSPRQERPQIYGEGFTTDRSSAELYEIDNYGTPQLLAGGVNDVNQLIMNIMRLDSNQFRQIVMLPQGEFQKLLFAPSREKEIILQRLFHTQIYKQIEERLKEKADRLKEQVHYGEKDRRKLLANITAKVNADLIQLLAEVGNNFEEINIEHFMGLLEAELKTAAKQLIKLEEQRESLSLKRNNLTEQLLYGQNILKQIEEKQRLKEIIAKLNEEKQVIKLQEKELSDARKALLLHQQEQYLTTLQLQITKEEAQLTNLQQDIVKLTEKVSNAEKSYLSEQDREQERQGLLNKINHLKLIEKEVYTLATLKNEHENLLTQTEKLASQLQEKQAKLDADELVIAKLTSKNEQSNEIKLKLVQSDQDIGNLRLKLDKLVEFINLQKKQVEINSQLLRHNKALKQISLQYEEKYIEVKKLENSWHNSQAQLLATNLKLGCPCPVCGSEDHPNPATITNKVIPNETEIKAAQQALQRLLTEKLKINEQYIKVNSEHEMLVNTIKERSISLAEQLPGFDKTNSEHLKGQIDEKILREQTNKKDLEQQLANILKNEKKLIKLQAEKNKLVKQINNDQQALSETRERLIKQSTLLEQSINAIPENVQSTKQYELKLTELTTNYQNQIKTLRNAEQTYNKLVEQQAREKARFETIKQQLAKDQEQLVQEQQLFHDNILKQNFANYEQYSKAKRSEQTINKLEKDIQSFREQLRSVTDQYENLTKTLSNIERPKLAAIEKQIAEVDEQYEKTSTKYTELFSNKQSNEKIAEQLIKVNDSLHRAEEEYLLIGHLANITRGQNALKISFERYVLAAFLDDILTAANLRLQKMTGGRFRLARNLERLKGNVQSGLDILVFDEHTGQERDVKTLSGGESFKAALSLALGLADIVQQYAGGVSLETMFIDEGFGTLDSESLEQAIEALVDIQNTGRLVAVISHVEELKERIDAQLEVIKTQSGSYTKFRFLSS